MIVTVTLNPAIDKVLLVNKVVPRTTVRARKVICDIGGKGTHVAWVLGKLGIKNTALGLLAGETGVKIERMLLGANVDTDFVWQENGDSRNSIIVLDDDGNSWMFAEKGYEVSKESVDSVLARVNSYAKRAKIMILSGGVPPNVRTSIYAEMISAAKKQGCLTLLDASGEYLRQGLKASPYIAKPNQEELNQVYQTQAESISELRELGQRVRAEFAIPWLIVTLAERGCLLLGDAVNLLYKPPQVKEVNSVGCGDIFVAGLVAKLVVEKNIQDAVAYACALGATAATSLGTAGHDCQLAAKLLKQVEVQDITEER